MKKQKNYHFGVMDLERTKDNHLARLKKYRKAIKEENVIIGTKQVLKNLKLGKISKVYVTSNCPKAVKQDLKNYSSIFDIEVVQLKTPNTELGVLSKKPFSISVLGLKGA